MKYPFLLAALLLCSANLAARHSDTDTLLQPDTLSLRQSDALSAQKSDAPFVRPPYLRPGDTIGIVTPARKLKEKADTAKVRERFEEWGLKVNSERTTPTANSPTSPGPTPGAPQTCRP